MPQRHLNRDRRQVSQRGTGRNKSHTHTKAIALARKVASDPISTYPMERPHDSKASREDPINEARDEERKREREIERESRVREKGLEEAELMKPQREASTRARGSDQDG